MGKTAVCIALCLANPSSTPRPSVADGRKCLEPGTAEQVPVAATLVVVPPTIIGQVRLPVA